MSITSAYSTKQLPDAVADLKNQSDGQKPRAVIYFGSARYDAASLASQMREAFPDSLVVGCSTAGEIAGGKMMSGSVAAMFLSGEIVDDAACALVEDLSSGAGIGPALAELEQHFGQPIGSLDIESYVGLVLADGLSGAEEKLLEKLGDRTDIFFIGGSAGDDLKFERTYVSNDGRTCTNAAALLVLRLKRGFDIVKTQSFRPTGKTLVATKVDEPARTVLEFNDKPALDAYAEALGVAPEQAASRFFEHPLGLMIEGEPYVRSPQRAEGGVIRFYCQIKENSDLAVLQATDIVADTRAVIEERKAALGEIRGLLEFQCILRTLQLRDEKRCEQYGEIFSGIPTAGFSTYGEAYLGHMNQTSTILLFR